MTGFDLSTAREVYVGNKQYGAIYLGDKRIWPASWAGVPLTFVVLSDGVITWVCSDASIPKTIEYSKNGGAWTQITSTTAGEDISVTAGDVLKFRGNNSTYGNASYYNHFRSTADVKVRGNIMSLINSSTFQTLTAFTSTYVFRQFFTGVSHLLDVSELYMPATTLTTGCYRHMFYNCSGFKVAPVLPAPTLVNSCYFHMFQHATSLIYIKCLATSVTATSALTSWTDDVGVGGVFVKATGMTGWPTGVNGIPSGWTVEEVAA